MSDVTDTLSVDTTRVLCIGILVLLNAANNVPWPCRCPFFCTADAQKSDIMSTLVTDVGTVSGDMKAVHGKLDSIMSLLSGMAGGKSQVVPSNPMPQPQNNSTGDDAAAAAGEGGGGGGVSFGGGGDTASFIAVEPQAPTTRGGYGQWPVGGGDGGGGSIRRGGHDPYMYEAPADYYTTPSLPVDHQQGHLLHSQLAQQPSAVERFLLVPGQVSE